MPSPGKIKVLLHNWGDHLNAAPMFSEIDQDQFTIVDVNGFLSVFEVSPLDVFLNLWDWSKPDLFLSFGDTDPSDQKRSRVYHEMTHASQYAMAGPVWWEQYVWYIIGISFTDQPGPYGDGSSPGSGRAELTEGMAEAHEHVIADNKYELLHSFSVSPQFLRYMNRAEVLTFNDVVESFIPEGLFFDLYDENGVFPAVVSRPEPNTITDHVRNFPFETQVQVFDLPAMENIDQFRTFLWQFHGNGSGNTLNDFNQLFQGYGH